MATRFPLIVYRGLLTISWTSKRTSGNSKKHRSNNCKLTSATKWTKSKGVRNLNKKDNVKKILIWKKSLSESVKKSRLAKKLKDRRLETRKNDNV